MKPILLNSNIYMKDRKYNIRFNYHKTDSGIYWRTTKLWWKPFMFIGNRLKNILYYFGVKTYSKKIWWVRKYLTYD